MHKRIRAQNITLYLIFILLNSLFFKNLLFLVRVNDKRLALIQRFGKELHSFCSLCSKNGIHLFPVDGCVGEIFQ